MSKLIWVSKFFKNMIILKKLGFFMEKNNKRVFFGFEIQALWLDLPKEKKIISENNRHITLLFLGENDINQINNFLKDLPKSDFEIGLVGYFNKCLFLPPKDPRLVAYQADFFEKNYLIERFQKDLFDFFKNRNFPLKQNNNFLPHVTICRNNFNLQSWKNSFKYLPLYIKSFNFYESLGNSEYNTLWKRDYINPFEEIPHTADIAFNIKGKTFSDLLYNSFIALSFKSIDFLLYYKELKPVESIDDVIINLNEIVTKAEIDGIFVPFKAISFHSKIEKTNDILNWEMIVDV